MLCFFDDSADHLNVHKPARRALRGLGLASLAVGVSLMAPNLIVVAANPLLAIRWHLPFIQAAAVEIPTPASTSSPIPRQHRGFLGDGPVVLRGTGNVGLGFNAYSRDGSNIAQNNISSGFNLQLERRTAESSVTLSQPFGYATGGTSVGQLLFGYRTPLYSLSYGSVTAPGESLIGLGGFARGVSLTMPRRNGDLSFIASTASQADGTAYRIYGVRRNINVRRGVLQSTALFGKAERGPGLESFVDLLYRRSGRTITSTSEIALSRTKSVAGLSDGNRLALAFHADAGSGAGFLSVDTKFIPNGIATLQSSIPPGLDVDVAYRRALRHIGNVSLDVAHDDTKLALDNATHIDRASFTIGRPIGAGSIQVVESLSRVRDASTSALSKQLGITLQQQIRGTSYSMTFQNSSVGGTGGDARQSQIGLAVGRTVFGGSLAFGSTYSTIASPESAASLFANNVTYSRPIGKKAVFSLTESILSNRSPGTVTSTAATTTLSLSRQISRSIAISTSSSITKQSGLGAGTATSFSAAVSGPINFGQTNRFTGKSNPNIPAIIRGSVSQITVASSPYDLSSTPRGYNNVLVVLDGRQTQRTDSTGQFEFRFVPQGTHTVSIEPATLGPGVIADNNSNTVRVLGGQTVDMLFTVGNFAGVTGRVSVQRNGVTTGLAGVSVLVDNTRSTTTGPDGRYAIGQLVAGAHTVSITELSIPSNVVIPTLSKSVSVANGIATPVDFVGETLGSIGGTVLFESGGGFGDFVGAKDVYVVAQPGEHAGITSESGMFLLDNLPPGTYTLEVDKDTLPEGQSVISGPTDPIVVNGGGSVGGVVFKLGAAAKDVVFTFNNGKKQPVVVDVSPLAAPPGAILDIVARTSAEVKALVVESDVFGNFPLKYMKDEKEWRASVIVPPLAKGNYSLTVSAKTKNVGDGEALIAINPALPLAIARTNPIHPKPGQTVRVTAKILGPVEEGDAIHFEDGYTIQLPKGKNRIFTFDVRIWSKGLPYSGVVSTKRNGTFAFSLR